MTLKNLNISCITQINSRIGGGRNYTNSSTGDNVLSEYHYSPLTYSDGVVRILGCGVDRDSGVRYGFISGNGCGIDENFFSYGIPSYSIPSTKDVI